MNRRWEAGTVFMLDGVNFRVVRGRKAPEDLRLEWFVGGNWTPVHMRIGAVMADFFFENEDYLYPPPAAGGRKYLGYIHKAARRGWQEAESTLRLDRKYREYRDGDAA